MSPAEFRALNVDPATREAYFRSRMVPEDDLPLPSSPALIDTGGRRVLVDTGWAGLDGPETAGHLVGDAVTTIHGAFERPGWHNLFDMDPERAADTRRQLLDRASRDEMLLLGYHFPFPGLGYAVRDGQAYRYYPAGGTVLT